MWKLATVGRQELGFGAPAITYIEEKRAERFLGRSIDVAAYSQSMAWGKACEGYLFWKEGLLGLEYSLTSKETDVHTEYPFWSGSKDVETKDKVGEIKCFYPKNFFELSRDLILQDVTKIKENHKEVYWQVVSNAIINKKPKAEIIAFMPTEEQLMELRQLIDETNFIEEVLKDDPWKYRFISEKPIWELPYIPTGVDYPNLVKFEFEVNTDDIEFLTKAVVNAEFLLSK
jgi:hypothetical protein